MLVFPEGRKGTEKLYKDRYRLRRFGRGGFVEAAMRAGAPIVPVAVVGAEEAMPIFAQRRPAAAPDRADLLPDHADVPALRACSASSATCRPSSASASSSRSRPTSGATSRGTTGPRADGRRGRPRPHPGGALRHARRAPVGVARMSAASSSPASRPTGAAGSRRRSSATRTVEAIIGVAPEDPTLRARAHRVRARRHPARAAAADRAGGRDRHRRRHAAGRRLDARRPPRVAHEKNVIGTMNILAACGGPGLAGAQGRLQVLRALLRLRARRPGVLHRGDAAPAPAAHARSSATSSRPSDAVARLRRAQPGRHGHRRCASATALGPDLRTEPHRAARAARGPVRSSASTRATSSSTRTTSSACSSTPSRDDLPGHLQRAPATACSRSRRSRPARQAARAGAAAVGHGPGRPRAAAALGLRDPAPRCRSQLRYGRGLDNRKLKAAGLPLRATRRARRCRRSPRHLRLRAAARERRGAIPLRARGRGVPALEPERASRDESRRLTRQRRLQGLPQSAVERVLPSADHRCVLVSSSSLACSWSLLVVGGVAGRTPTTTPART